MNVAYIFLILFIIQERIDLNSNKTDQLPLLKTEEAQGASVQKTIVTLDTSKRRDTSFIVGKNYIVAGSYLIPRNADNQIAKLKSLGFNKTFKYNFPESEFYSVVVD